MGNDAPEKDKIERKMKDSPKIVGLLCLLLFGLSLPSNAQVSDELDLNNGLIGHYPLNGTTLDKTGNGNDLTPTMT